MTTATSYPHLVIDDAGYLRTDPGWYKLIVIIEGHIFGGMTAEDLVEAHEGLTLAAAHSMLAYYYDHKVAVNNEVETRIQESEKARQEIEARQGLPPFHARLQAIKRLLDERSA